MKDIGENLNVPHDLSAKKSEIALREEATLAMWQEKKIFEKSLEQTKEGESFTFYDGPPFATGLPHYGHILMSTIKDTIPRYQTMRGRHVRRVWGWDCHGLPIENLIENELGLGHKKDIEEYGIGKFNEAARASVLRYDTEWKKMIPRIGRFIDMEHAYSTMDANYTESIWWAFKTLAEKNLIYQGFKAMQICPRCETTLSNNEVADGYKDITDISVTVKFELVDEPDTFILAWTTTPWTLPGNVALAVNPEEEYAEVLSEDKKYIIAKARVEKVFEGKEFQILATMKGAEIVGKSYKPVFDYYASDTTLENHANGWKVYGADFVTVESGTGVVHIAPAFGEDDMALGKKENLPFVQHVAMDGTIKKEVHDFAGVQAKPKGDHQATDILIIKHLAGLGALFSKEKIIHAYPHCWRCDTPLLNYATGSWFVRVTDLKDKLLSENAKTKWVPENLRDGRFGNWLSGARDWAISRSRFWGAPIPVWDCTVFEKREIIGSRAELALRTKKSGNKYFVMRHGEAESNARNIVNSEVATSPNFGLTAKGIKDVEQTGEKLKDKNIDVIIVSPFVRTKQTADIVAQSIGFDAEKIIIDERIKETNTGIFDGRPIDEYRGYFSSMREKFTKRPESGENLLDIKRRTMALLEELDEKYTNKKILIVTHEYPIWMLMTGIEGAGIDRGLEIKDGKEDFVLPAEVVEIPFVPFPHNADYELDVHRPYIDELPIVCDCGGKMKRVEYVFDCWFESGSMPYAQFHYPFENKELFEKNFPADFIAEGIDQTRGWFYNMLNLSVGLFGKTPFKQVMVSGMVLAEDGQKMSKKLKNYPDPWDILNTYGADAVRYYLIASPIVHAEDTAFSEKGVDEVVKKVIGRTMNVLSFYELYRSREVVTKKVSPHPLDRWILARLAELQHEMTGAFDRYELERAVKPIGLFVDDLSTWYIRRSRDRFKSDDEKEYVPALHTTHLLLLEFSKLLAPVMPFLAEHIYSSLNGAKESVHLENWPLFNEPNYADLASMTEVRRIVSLALEARAKAGIKVRQPLAKLLVKSTMLVGKKELTDIILDEVNVKEVIVLPAEGESQVELDTTLTDELRREGVFRDFVRALMAARKEAGLTPGDTTVLIVRTEEEGKKHIGDFAEELKKAALLRDIVYQDKAGEITLINGFSYGFSVEK
jgi:isoleucyl-tRNA synthetase